jgi:hypothetical protein
MSHHKARRTTLTTSIELRRSGGVRTTAMRRRTADATATTTASGFQKPPSRTPSTSINPNKSAATIHSLGGESPGLSSSATVGLGLGLGLALMAISA